MKKTRYTLDKPEGLKDKERLWLLFRPKENRSEYEASITRSWDIQGNKLRGTLFSRSSHNPSLVNS